jgi:hypothetical protein
MILDDLLTWKACGIKTILDTCTHFKNLKHSVHSLIIKSPLWMSSIATLEDSACLQNNLIRRSLKSVSPRLSFTVSDVETEYWSWFISASCSSKLGICGDGLSLLTPLVLEPPQDLHVAPFLISCDSFIIPRTLYFRKLCSPSSKCLKSHRRVMTGFTTCWKSERGTIAL